MDGGCPKSPHLKQFAYLTHKHPLTFPACAQSKIFKARLKRTPFNIVLAKEQRSIKDTTQLPVKHSTVNTWRQQGRLYKSVAADTGNKTLCKCELSERHCARDNSGRRPWTEFAQFSKCVNAKGEKRLERRKVDVLRARHAYKYIRDYWVLGGNLLRVRKRFNSQLNKLLQSHYIVTQNKHSPFFFFLQEWMLKRAEGSKRKMKEWFRPLDAQQHNVTNSRGVVFNSNPGWEWWNNRWVLKPAKVYWKPKNSHSNHKKRLIKTKDKC